ncbi:MAG: UDP-glucose/GDP-mannose dehydrogenase family protein [Candidatus Harrisonbacteria bacterium]|nr:UDP-glucose/GDP-mannose dehydrogenase family protein [Candidatus Harrisonbacteria bacterium]
MAKKVGIIGVGMVGGALARYFFDVKRMKRGVDIFCYDADVKKGYSDDINRADIIFVAVPTPRNKKTGACDTAIVEEVFRTLADGKIAVIKSTVPPGTTDALQKKFPRLTVLFSPEFLTEKNSWSDTIEPARQIVGFTKGNEAAAREVLALLPAAPFMSPSKTAHSTASEAELIKYAGNVYLSRKVCFANALAKIAEKIGADYNHVRAGMGADTRIGKSHLDVDYNAYRGFGGYCFPKDTSALMMFAKGAGLDDVYKLLKSDWDFNEKLLAAQGLTIDDVSHHDAEIQEIIQRVKKSLFKRHLSR